LPVLKEAAVIAPPRSLVERPVRDSTGARKNFRALAADFGQAALEEPLFGLLLREGQRRLIAGLGLREAPEAAQ
jgi:hypothetical protein